MIETLSKATTNFDNLPKVKKLLRKALEDQDTILADGQNLKKEEYDKFYENLYKIYDLVQLNDAGEMVVDGEIRKDITGDELEFPGDRRGPADFVSNLQKLWVFLKVHAERAAASGETYAEEVLPVFHQIFADAYPVAETPAVREVQSEFEAAENRRQHEIRQAKVSDQFKTMEKYLMPETEVQQIQELEQMSELIRESTIDAGTEDRERFLNDFRQILKDYNQLKNQKEQQTDFKDLYTRLYSKIYCRMQLDQGNSLNDQFPENTRNAENFELSVQKAWIFLKGFTEVAKDDKQLLGNVATYAEYFKRHEFEASYKEAVKKDKWTKITKTVDTYREARDKVMDDARTAAQDAYDECGKKSYLWNNIAGSKEMTTHEKLEKTDQMIGIWADQINKLKKSSEDLKKLQENQEKLAAKGLLKENEIQKEKKDIKDVEEWIQTELDSWEKRIGDGTLQLKEELKLEVNELEKAMISFEAAAAEKLSVSSGHADTFRSISEAVAAYQNVTPENEKECAANLYKACRDYLHAHTQDGTRQYEIGGQGTQTGRVRKAAVVKLLEIMEKRADDGRTEFKDARIAYHEAYLRDNGSLCPALDLNALKTSLAEHSKANVDPTRAAGGDAMRALKAYAELDKVRDGYLKKLRDAQKKQVEADRKRAQKRKAQKGKAPKQ